MNVNYPKKLFAVLINYHEIVKKMFKIGRFYMIDGDVVLKKILDFGDSETRINMKVISFGKCITSIDAVKEIRNQGFRLAIAGELFVFCKQYSEIYKHNLIVALGSYHFGNDLKRYVSCSNSDNCDNELYLSWLDGDCWSENQLFLVVPN